MILVHNVLVVLICIKRYSHEINENFMRFTDESERNCVVVPKSLESFLSNCLVMGVCFISFFTFEGYRR